MMDPSKIFPRSYHPSAINKSRDFSGSAKHLTRTQRPPKYYLIDFGISRHYPHNGSPLEEPIRGGDKTVPEFRDLYQPCNPFPTDIYYIGNMVRGEFLQVCMAGISGATCCADILISADSDLISWRASSPIWFKMIPENGRRSTRSSHASMTFKKG